MALAFLSFIFIFNFFPNFFSFLHFFSFLIFQFIPPVCLRCAPYPARLASTCHAGLLWRRLWRRGLGVLPVAGSPLFSSLTVVGAHQLTGLHTDGSAAPPRRCRHTETEWKDVSTTLPKQLADVPKLANGNFM